MTTRTTATRPAPARRISLALQGGGAHGAFTWGVLDRLLEDGRLAICAVSGTSAGAMNAAALAAGHARDGATGARRALDHFWRRTGEYGAVSPFRRTWLDRLAGRWNLDRSPGYRWFDALSRVVSPYQSNPLNHHPLRTILEQQIDIDAVRACTGVGLFVTATNVRTGQARVFTQADVTIDALLASACLPHLYQAVEIDGDPYWDGGYMGNPAIWPLIYRSPSADVVLVQLNPLTRPGVPRTVTEIDNRLNEIAFNSALIHEMRAIAFVKRLIAEDALKEPAASRYRDMRIHVIADDAAILPLGATSKLNAEPEFLDHLRGLGRAAAERWLAANFEAIGERSTVDLNRTFLAGRAWPTGVAKTMPP